MASYATPAELRTQIDKTGTTGPAADAALQIFLDAATAALNLFCNRPDGFTALTTATARLYRGSGSAVQLIDENVSVTLVEVKDTPTDSTYTAWAATDWIAFRGDPVEPDFNNTPYDGLMIDPNGAYSIFTDGRFTGLRGFSHGDLTRGVPTVRITAKWGYAVTAPVIVKEVCIIQAARWYKKGESAHADMIASGELGTLQYKGDLDSNLAALLRQARLVKPAVGRR